MSTTTRKQLDLIKEKAIALWGDKWLSTLVNEYCAIAEVEYKGRYRTIQRIFENGDCRLSTVNILLECVNSKLRLADKNETDF